MVKKGDSNVQDKKDKGGTPFHEMSRRRKTMFICKVIISVLTFGFAFPDVMND